MHTIFYITGPAASGKSTLVSKLRNGQEIEIGYDTPSDEIILKIERGGGFKESMVVTSQIWNRRHEKVLRDYCEINQKIFFSLKLNTSTK